MAKTFKYHVSFPVTVKISTNEEAELEKLYNEAVANLADPAKRAEMLGQLIAAGPRSVAIIESGHGNFETFLERVITLQIRSELKDMVENDSYHPGPAKVLRVV